MATLLVAAERSNLIRRNTDWSKSKKETKLVALRDKKRKKAGKIVLAGQKFFGFFNFVKMLKNLNQLLSF